MATPSQVRFPAVDIWDSPDDGNRYEVIEGELVMSPPPAERHQRGLFALSLVLGQPVKEHRLGRVYFAPIGVVLSVEDGLQPDLVYVSNERAGIITERGIEGAPDLVVEVLSPSTRARDRGLKMRRYAAAGIPNYWMLDPVSGNLEAYLLGEGGYALDQSCAPSEVFRPLLFPGLEIAIEQLWA